MSEKIFTLTSKYEPAGDQPQAIKSLVQGVCSGASQQTLLGVTGSGKTYTIANVIAQIGKPTLVIAHNKTLAAQLAQEYREFFPQNAVHYFVSYYDYYQPEAYMPVTDTYIEKEAQINEEIDRLRHASTQALLTRKDVIIVASVSCIYGLGSPEEYEKVNLKIEAGKEKNRAEFIRELIGIYFNRITTDLTPGFFRALGNTVEVMPTSDRVIIRVLFDGDTVARIERIDPVTRAIISEEKALFIFPAKHFVSSEEQSKRAFETIKLELEERLVELTKAGKDIEAQRLKRRVQYDLSMIREIGYCSGIENYSRHFSGKKAGEAPDTLLSYFPHKADGTPDFLTVIDESHVTIPQIGGMYAGDKSRKDTLVEHGFRLPSARDNRPLTFAEFEKTVGQTIFVSATPGKYEMQKVTTPVEMIVRPTGLIDPEITIRPVTESGAYKGQVFDFIEHTVAEVKKGGRVIATTLTKKMAEDLAEFLREKKVKAEYLHSEIQTIDRIEILTRFRRGEFDCLVGVNLLREGLDLPEVTFIGILDADKEGFLRSETSLIQIIGRAARNVNGHVTMYADTLTGSIDRAMKETARRRTLQIAYNTKHNITPQTIIKTIKDITEELRSDHRKAVDSQMAIDKIRFEENPEAVLKEKYAQMEQAVADLDFETAALLRDEIFELEKLREHETASRMKTDPEFKAKVKLAEKHTRWEGKKKGRKLIKEE
jgi:excinuclease ABC subunit B